VAHCVRFIFPALTRWAKLCRTPTKESGRTDRAYGAWIGARRVKGVPPFRKRRMGHPKAQRSEA